MLLEWPEHSSQILRGVNSLKAFYDVTLSAEGQEIKAHRVILAAASTYFNVSFSTFLVFLLIFYNCQILFNLVKFRYLLIIC